MPAQPQTIHDLEKGLQNLQIQPGISKNSTRYLILEGVVEVLRVYRLHVEEKIRMAEEERGRARERRHHRHGKHRHRDKGRDNDHVISDPNIRSNQDLRYMMSGGAGPLHKDAPPGERGHVQIVEPEGHKNEQHRCHHGKRKRSPPLGPPPTYKPKLGWTLGFGRYVKRCIKYEAERRAKEARRQKRKADRDARKKTKSADHGNAAGHVAGGHSHAAGEHPGHSPRRANDYEGYERVYEPIAQWRQEGERTPEDQHTPRADIPVYEANSQRHAVEE
ncbi:hypothetical protein BCR34DRAFT_582711 [Clohesyomyces aquaticus]|uniref:Uncharacterized protein n=1 Tax=Clohesyomyces aquaticus TaxID=1231657 RepID=A0A1Y2A8E3_9PLEO|nr:hypothetical protein BCR34DRAFT_582711 [Clohesyomyces aquaticus]